LVWPFTANGRRKNGKKVYKWKRMLRRPLGRPKNRWEDDIRNGMKKLKIKNWTNSMQDKLTRHKNIINYIKAQRLSWFGHLHRIPKETMVKKSIQVETDVKKTTRETKEQMGR
jgi:hypothetical protein